MKKFISILLTTSMLAGSAAMPFAAIAAETVTTASRASEAAKTGTLTVTVYNEDEGGLYTDERTSFMITGSPDQTMSYGMGGSTFLCSVKPSESNPFVLNDIDIISNTNYTIIDSGSPDYDGFNYRIDYERSDRTFKFTENPNQDLSIYMKKNYFVVNSDKSVTVATHGQDIFDNMQAVMSQTLELINSDDFKALATADRISKAKELMKSLSDDELIADYAFDAEKNVMSFTYKCGTITGQLRPAVFEDKHKQLRQGETTEAKEEVSYKIVKLPDKVEYKVGESISLNGIQVEVKKGNEEPIVYTYPDVAFDYQSNIPKAPSVILHSDFRSDKAGTYKVEVVGADNLSFDVKVVDDSTIKDLAAFEEGETMTIDDVIELSKKGNALTLNDLAKFKGVIAGSGIFILEYDLGKGYTLMVGSMTLEKIDYARLRYSGSENFIDIRTDDVEKYLSTSAEVSNIKGDANCDGQVDLSDAVMIMQALANPNKYGLDGTAEHHLTEQGKLNGDMNGDGLTSGDALAIQRKLLGLDDEEKSFSTTLLGIDKAKVIGVKVSSLPEGYDYSFTDENAQSVVDYLSNISLSTNLSVEDPGQLDGMTWVIRLVYENGDTVTLYDLGKFIHGTDRKWYEMTYEESQEFSNLVWKLGKSDNDKNIDNSEYLIGNEPSVSVMKPQRLALNCNSFCANGETLKIQMLMGDKYTYNQEHNSYPNFDSDGNPEYTIFATENYKKINDERLVVNGAKSEYTKAFTKEDMKSLDITGKEGDYTAYYTDTAEIDFSSYPSGSTGCISVSFGWKADGVNPHNTSSDFDGTSQTIYFYVGENGTGISNNGWEAAQKAYEDKSDNDIMFYDSLYVKWNGKEVMSNLYDALRKPSDAVLPINFKLSMSPDYNFEYKGKKLSEYSNANYSEEMMKLKDLQMYGNQLKYGETIYTTGMPDGTKRTKEWYEERVEYFGEELLSKYIVDGEFLEEKLRVDINELMKNNRIANEEAEKAFYSYISDEAIKQLDKQNIKYEYMTEPKRLVIYVTAEEFKAMKLDNVSRYGLDISVAKGVTVNAIA